MVAYLSLLSGLVLVGGVTTFYPGRKPPKLPLDWAKIEWSFETWRRRQIKTRCHKLLLSNLEKTVSE